MEWEAPEPAGTVGAAWGRHCPSEAPKGREGSFFGRETWWGQGTMLLAVSGPRFWSVGLAVTGLVCLGARRVSVLFPVLHGSD